MSWLPFEELVQAHAAWRQDPNERTERAYRTVGDEVEVQLGCKTGDPRQQAIAYEREQVSKTERYYEEVGLRQAQLVYPGGMIGGAILIGTLAWGIWVTTGQDFSTRIALAIMMGAAGAVLSVMQRMTNRKQGFELDYELGRAPLVVFGIFRPLLGAAFGGVLYAAIASGVVKRLAKDVLDAAETTVGAAIKPKHEPST